MTPSVPSLVPESCELLGKELQCSPSPAGVTSGLGWSCSPGGALGVCERCFWLYGRAARFNFYSLNRYFSRTCNSEGSWGSFFPVYFFFSAALMYVCDLSVFLVLSWRWSKLCFSSTLLVHRTPHNVLLKHFSVEINFSWWFRSHCWLRSQRHIRSHFWFSLLCTSWANREQVFPVELWGF